MKIITHTIAVITETIFNNFPIVVSENIVSLLLEIPQIISAKIKTT
jgi:hypothetical protein